MNKSAKHLWTEKRNVRWAFDMSVCNVRNVNMSLMIARRQHEKSTQSTNEKSGPNRSQKMKWKKNHKINYTQKLKSFLLELLAMRQ